MIRSTASTASSPKSVLGTPVPSLSASILAICLKTGSQVEDKSECEEFLAHSVTPASSPRLVLPRWQGSPKSLHQLQCQVPPFRRPNNILSNSEFPPHEGRLILESLLSGAGQWVVACHEICCPAPSPRLSQCSQIFTWMRQRQSPFCIQPLQHQKDSTQFQSIDRSLLRAMWQLRS